MGDNCGSSRKNRRNFTDEEKLLVYNVYEGLRAREKNLNVGGAVTLCSILTKVSEKTIYRIKKEKKTNSVIVPLLETRGRKRTVLDENTKSAIRREIHQFYSRNEIPNVKKLFSSLRANESLPKISRRVLLRTLKAMHFKYLKRTKNNAIVEKDEIILWRRTFLKALNGYRSVGRKIYYVDETWLEEESTASSIKGKRLIITHIGSEEGFLDEGFSVIESKKKGDSYEDMDAERFESWFSKVITKIPPGSVVVMDSAPYHSRRSEKLPTTSWKKSDIAGWLDSKKILFDKKMLKTEILDIARSHKEKYLKYAVDELALERGVIVLRLPPYHCDLNPIGLVWEQIKKEFIKNNSSFELNDVKTLLSAAISGVTEEMWHKHIQHVIKEEAKMWQLDEVMETVLEPVMTNLYDSETEESDFDDFMEFEENGDND